MHDPHHVRRAYRPRQEQTRRGGFLAALFYCGLALIMIVLAVGTFLVVAAPVDIFRDQIAAQVKARTGRDLVIAGRSSLTLYPSLGLSFGNVTLSPPPGMEGPPTIATEQLDVTVALAPLLSREIEVQRLVLRRPVIHLATDARGRRSWQFTELADVQPVQVAQAATGSLRDTPKELQEFVRGSSPNAVAGGGLLARLKAGEVRIEQGTVIIADARAGTAERITNLDARLSYRGLASPVAVSGQALARDEAVDFDLKIASPDRLADGQPSKVDFTLSTRTTRARFEGIWSPGQTQVEGNFDVEAQSGESMARLARQPGLAAFTTPVKVAALVRLNETGLNIPNGRIESGPWNATGSLSVEATGPRPLVRGNLRVSEIDVPRIEALAAVAAEGARRAPPLSPMPPANGAAPAPQGIGDLIERTIQEPQSREPRVKGFLKRSDWSDSPIDAAALGLVDADIKVSTSRVILQQASFGPTQATIGLRAGVLRVSFDDVQLYEGRARGTFALDSTGRVPSFTLSLNADGVAIQPLLRDLADNERVSGRARLVLALAGSGRTERQMMMSLEGKGDVVVTNGAVTGLDGMQQVLGILQGKTGQAGGRTEFSEASGSVVVTAGVARNQDLKLIGSGLRVTGAGDIDIGQRQVDYLFRPRADAVSIEVPVRARGPWDDVRYAAEVNREKAVEALKELGRQFQGQNVGEIVRGLTQPGENGEPSKAQKLLDKFLKRQ